MSQCDLARRLLLSTLVGTLYVNCTGEVTAQAIKNLSSTRAKQEQTIEAEQDLLERIDIIQQEAETLRQAVDIFNLQLQEQFKSRRIKNTVDFKQVLADWEQFHKIWRDFSQDLEQDPKFAQLIEETKLVNNIDQNLLYQQEIISTLAELLNESSTLIITKFQEQIFTKRELIRNYYHHGTFDTRTQHKFALISTNKARELELQVSQIENILVDYLLNKKQNTSHIIAGTNDSTTSKDATELAENFSGKNRFLNWYILIALTFLASMAILLILRLYKKNSSVMPDRGVAPDIDPEISSENITEYLQNLERVENRSRELLNSASQIIESKKALQQSDYFSASQKQHQTNLNFSSSSLTKIFTSKTSKQIIEKSSPINSSLVVEEDLIALYHHSPNLLSQKVIKVDLTPESRKLIRAGQESEIIFQPTSNHNYWIAMEPKLENNCYFLVPKPNLEIDFLINSSLKKIFKCKGYSPEKTHAFSLKLSAMVQVASGNSWKLIGTGELDFS